jgi:hypothetical protein
MTGRLALAALLAFGLLGGSARADQLTFAMRLEHGQLPPTMRIVRVKQGDVVTLRWSTDQPGELHIHGYDIERTLTPGTITEVTITARATGRFPMHLHGPTHDEATLGYFEVYPR